MPLRYRKSGSSGGTGPPPDIPPGAAVMSDALDLEAELAASDALDTPGDAGTFALDAAYSEDAGMPDEALLLGVVAEDTAATPSDDFALALTADDALAPPSDTLVLGLTADDALALASEDLTFGAPYADDMGPPSDARSVEWRAFGQSVSSTGGGVVNQNNAIGPNDGAVAVLQPDPLQSAESLTVTIPASAFPPSGALSLLIWYRVRGTISVGAAVAVTYANAGGSPATHAAPNTVAATAGFLANPYEVALTALSGADATVTFAITGDPLRLAVIDVDAIAIRGAGLA